VLATTRHKIQNNPDD